MMNSRLMGTASTAALVIAGVQQAAADGNSVLAGYTLDIQGTVGNVDGVWEDKVEADFDDKTGVEDGAAFMGAIALKRQMAPSKDMSLGLSFGVGDGDTFTSSFSGSSFGSSWSGTETVSDSFKFAALDFEMGTTVPAGPGSLRLFYGARALGTSSVLEPAFEIEYETSGRVSGGSVELEEKFVGFGPRVGAGFSTLVSPTSQFGISGEIGAAYLFGQRDKTGTETNYDEVSSFSSSFSISDSESAEAISLDAQIGVDYHLSDSSKVSLGYQAQQFWNVDDKSDDDNDSDWAGPRLMQGVYIGFTTTF